jgi:hypothetical protein
LNFLPPQIVLKCTHPPDLANEQWHVLASACDKILIVHRRAGKVDILTARHDEVVAAVVIAAFNI